MIYRQILSDLSISFNLIILKNIYPANKKKSLENEEHIENEEMHEETANGRENLSYHFTKREKFQEENMRNYILL